MSTGGSAWLRFSPMRWWSVVAFGSAGAMGRWIALVESNRHAKRVAVRRLRHRAVSRAWAGWCE
eukprot:COSAG04_NODE_32365_length_251_cov_1.026316_1_plen_63_part_10